MTTESRISEAGLRVLNTLKALRGQSLNGLSNSELANRLQDSKANVNRSVNTLIAAGLAVRLDSGRFALSVAMLQIAQAHADEMARAQNRIHELNQRVLAGAHL
jgi:DNA-binding IclR family transcriptional regulator